MYFYQDLIKFYTEQNIVTIKACSVSLSFPHFSLKSTYCTVLFIFKSTELYYSLLKVLYYTTHF